MALVVAMAGCQNLPSLEGTRCDEPEQPCGGELGCVGGVCLKLVGEPIACEQDGDCAAQDPRRPFCVTGGNEDPRDNFCAGCGHDTHCAPGVCIKQGYFCIGCTQHAHCDTGLCTGNVCRSCKGDSQCAGGQCVDGRCVSCAGHDECASGWCDQGVCRSCKVDKDCCQGARPCKQWRCEDRICKPAGEK